MPANGSLWGCRKEPELPDLDDLLRQRPVGYVCIHMDPEEPERMVHARCRRCGCALYYDESERPDPRTPRACLPCAPKFPPGLLLALRPMATNPPGNVPGMEVVRYRGADYALAHRRILIPITQMEDMTDVKVICCPQRTLEDDVEAVCVECGGPCFHRPVWSPEVPKVCMRCADMM